MISLGLGLEMVSRKLVGIIGIVDEFLICPVGT
jgi:hypothetical protein